MLPRTFIYFLFIDLTSAGSSEQLPVYVVDCMLTVAAAVAVLLSTVAAKSTHFRRKSWHIRNESKHSFKGFYIIKKKIKTRSKQYIAYKMPCEARLALLVINQTLILGTPAWYKKLEQQTFENNSNRLRTNLDPFTGVFRLPSGNNNESRHKTVCWNVLSSF